MCRFHEYFKHVYGQNLTSADLERRNKKGMTPLQLGVRSGHLDVTEELLTRGARSNVITKSGLCLCCLANSSGHGYLEVSLVDSSLYHLYDVGICTLLMKV